MRKYLPNLIGLVVGYAVTVLLIVLMAFLFMSDALTENYAPAAAITALAVGSGVGGLVSAYIKKSKGMLCGALTGLAMFLSVLAVALFSDEPFTINTLIKFLSSLVFAAVGGIVGVNLSSRRKMI